MHDPRNEGPSWGFRLPQSRTFITLYCYHRLQTRTLYAKASLVSSTLLSTRRCPRASLDGGKKKEGKGMHGEFPQVASLFWNLRRARAREKQSLIIHNLIIHGFWSYRIFLRKISIGVSLSLCLSFFSFHLFIGNFISTVRWTLVYPVYKSLILLLKLEFQSQLINYLLNLRYFWELWKYSNQWIRINFLS